MRVEVLDDRYLYAIRIVRPASALQSLPGRHLPDPRVGSERRDSARARSSPARAQRDALRRRRRRWSIRHSPSREQPRSTSAGSSTSSAGRRSRLLLRRQRDLQLRGQRADGARVRPVPPLRGLHRPGGDRSGSARQDAQRGSVRLKTRKRPAAHGPRLLCSSAILCPPPVLGARSPEVNLRRPSGRNAKEHDMSEFRHVYRTELSPVSFLTPQRVRVPRQARRSSTARGATRTASSRSG